MTESAHPTLFHPAPHDPSSLTHTEKLAIVTASAPSFSETSSRLSTLKDLPVPPASPFAQLVALKPRLERAEMLQEKQRQEMRELRARSAKVLERWYESGVLGMGECWAEWEGRVGFCEREVRRKERSRREEREGEGG